jgi:hypothetical protein
MHGAPTCACARGDLSGKEQIMNKNDKRFSTTPTAALVTNSGRSAWFVGVLVLMVYLVFAMSLYLLPPRAQ